MSSLPANLCAGPSCGCRRSIFPRRPPYPTIIPSFQPVGEFMSDRQCRKCRSVKAASEFYGPTRHTCRACRSRQVKELRDGLRAPTQRAPRPMLCSACGRELRRGRAGGVLVCDCKRQVKPVAEQTGWERWAARQNRNRSQHPATGFAKWANAAAGGFRRWHPPRRNAVRTPSTWRRWCRYAGQALRSDRYYFEANGWRRWARGVCANRRRKKVNGDVRS